MKRPKINEKRDQGWPIFKNKYITRKETHSEIINVFLNNVFRLGLVQAEASVLGLEGVAS